MHDFHPKIRFVCGFHHLQTAQEVNLTNLQAGATEDIRLCLRGIVWEVCDSISPCPRECDAKGRVSSSAGSRPLDCIHSVTEGVIQGTV